MHLHEFEATFRSAAVVDLTGWPMVPGQPRVTAVAMIRRDSLPDLDALDPVMGEKGEFK